MKILFAASECTPFVKTGGLADVIGSLPESIASFLKQNKKKKSQVIVLLPKYSLIDQNKFVLIPLNGKIFVPIGDGVAEGTVWILDKKKTKENIPENVSFYFISNDGYFARPGLYKGEQDYPDNDQRFIFFSRAVLECCKFIDFVPDLIHCHDWETGLIPAFLKTVYKFDAFFHKTASLFTIHNVDYQGIFDKRAMFMAGLAWYDFVPERFEFYGHMNFMKAGIVYADMVSTVSSTYAQEIQSSHEYGCGLEGVIAGRSKDLTGILNGIDYAVWNPEKDPFISANFSSKSKDILYKKKMNKLELQKAVGLSQDETVPLIGMVSRLYHQKGFHFVVEILPKILMEGRKSQWVILGHGDPVIHDVLTGLSKRFPENIAFDSSFNDPLAHKIYAGSDFFLMPSIFEPCGLGQMIAMIYGTVPVVTPTGGLKETVKPWNKETGQGTGFFSKEITAPSLIETINEAFSVYMREKEWKKIVRNAMSKDFSWNDSAQKYISLYESAIRKYLT